MANNSIRSWRDIMADNDERTAERENAFDYSVDPETQADRAAFYGIDR